MRKINRLWTDRGSVLLAIMSVILILLLIFFAVLSFSLSTLARLRSQINQTRAAYMAEAGINRFLYVLGDSTSWRDAINISLNEKISETESFSITAGIAGAYISVESVGWYRATKISKTALIGRLPDRKFNSAIINGASEYPLTVAGRTKIIGDITVGPASVTKGELHGEYYIGDKYNEGNVISCTNSPLGGIDTSLISTYKASIRKKANHTDNIRHGSLTITRDDEFRTDEERVLFIDGNLELNNAEMHSFKSRALIYCTGQVEIRGRNDIDGLLEIFTEDFAIFHPGSIIRNIVVMARDSIIFAPESYFTGQAISEGSININDGAILKYPTVVYACGSFPNKKISFDNGSRASAIGVMEGYNPLKIDSSTMFVALQAKVSGLLYSGNYIDLRGTLNGIAASNYFHYQDEQSLYINWLKDAYIDRSNLDFLPILPVSLLEGNKYALFQVLE